MSTNTTNVLMVFPRFSPNSFWNYWETCAVAGKKYSAAPLGMITVAALLPSEWPVRLVDRNIEELHDGDLDWADMVMIGNMMPQQEDAKRVIALAHARNKPVVLGGPDVSCSPEIFEEVEFRLLGEVEEIMSDFLAAWRRGDKRGLFTAKTFPDIHKSPVPRFDLLKFQHYMHVGVQYSRGCPFNCEFCNVIELNGRVPRLKTTEQVLRELDALHALGYRGHVDVVDDNFIGNPKTVRPFLERLGDWNEAKGRPFAFSAEASLNLADSDETLALMRQAGFFAVFVGIETPDPETLVSVNKKQNTGRDLKESIHKIYQAGIFVNAGFIIGFDAEKDSVAEAMIHCIEDMAIPVCMVGLLYALPNTQLSRRLQQEGRLHPETCAVGSEDMACQCTAGLNYETLRPREKILEDYRAVLKSIYHPTNYFGRVRRAARILEPRPDRLRNVIPGLGSDLRSFARISWRLGVRDREVRGAYWKALGDCIRHNPSALKLVVSFAALYLHLWPFTRYMDDQLRGKVEYLPLVELGLPAKVARG
ncbi:MAG: B12-binding domain-containing radical SAM protein [Candidatus Krumholzibacteria bacterium]|nr:B12-binding domain-containing radical SAM protein [Candidatus Krumholzibacteria bacterium]